MRTALTTTLSERFDEPVVKVITAAYATALATTPMTYEGRLAIVQALMDEAEAGHTDPAHLLEVAQIFVPPRQNP